MQSTYKTKQQKFVTFGLRETYHELGVFEFKIVLNPKFFKIAEFSNVVMKDSDDRAMKYSVERWGRKINFKFTVDKTVSDGVSVVELDIIDNNMKSSRCRLTFWVIKP